MKKSRRLLGLGACALTLAACAGDTRDHDESAEGQPAEAALALVAVDPDVVRFLEQATFGPTPTDVAAIIAHGGSTPSAGSTVGAGYVWWIDEQLKLTTKTRYDSLAGCANGHPGITCVQEQFFDHAVRAPNQLRQRVAFALSEILVVSKVKLTSDAMMAPYLNLLVDHALSNDDNPATIDINESTDFGDLLQAVAESPAMGKYPDNVNNFVVDANGKSVAPNENFARELMQLFTIGLCDLSLYGLPMNGVCTPPYSQEDVEHYAHLMSGWTLNTSSETNVCPANGTPRASGSLTASMIACDGNHDATQLPLLKTYGAANTHYASVPGARAAMESKIDSVHHTSGVIDELFRHPNVGPFISKQLIQRLVTSNPTGVYVRHVAEIFNNDGSGRRGNLAAVVRTILTDPAARTAPEQLSTVQNNRYGRLREPALYIAGLARLLNIPQTTGFLTAGGPTSMTGVVQTSYKYAVVGDSTSQLMGTYGKGFRDASAAMGQDVFYSPTVFNYFPPDYTIPPTLLASATATMIAPELAIEDTNTIFERANFVDNLLYQAGALLPAKADLSALPSDAQGLVDWCNVYMMHGKMLSDVSSLLLGTTTTAGALTQPGLTDDERRQRAIYLVATSSQYQVAR